MTCWPLDSGCIVTSAFGPRSDGFHYGADLGFLGGSCSRPVYAARTGRVVHAGAADGFGGPSPAGWLVLANTDGSTNVYGHIVGQARLGDDIREGQQIGFINPNQSTNGGVPCHLHFEHHLTPGWSADVSKRIDPIPLLRSARYPGGPMQLHADITALSPNDGGPRDPKKCQFAIVHTNEGPADGSVQGLLTYLQDPLRQASYTLVVGDDGTIGRSNDDNYIPWAAGSPANERGLHLCFLGYSRQTREEWRSRPKQLIAGAKVLRDWSDRYGLPLTKISGDEMRRGVRGVGGHKDTVDAWHATDHTDPGPGFPYDIVLKQAAAIGSPTTGGFMAALTEAEQHEALDHLRWLRAQFDVPDPFWGSDSSFGTSAAGKPLTFHDSFADLRRRLLKPLIGH